MSDSQSLSKAAKKNKKRNAAKKKKGHGSTGGDSKDDGHFDLEDVLDSLKAQLEVAKQDKDHKRASQLRQQIFVVTDMLAGVTTDIPEHQLRPILEGIPQFNMAPAPKTTSESKPEVMSSGLNELEKKLRALRKKLDQIQRLKEMQNQGQKMQENQLQKIATEKEIEDDIRNLEDALSQVKIRH